MCEYHCDKACGECIGFLCCRYSSRMATGDVGSKLTSQRAETRKPFNFRKTKGISALHEECLQGKMSFKETSMRFQWEILKRCAEEFDGNFDKASAFLCMNRTTFWEIYLRCERKFGAHSQK